MSLCLVSNNYSYYNKGYGENQWFSVVFISKYFQIKDYGLYKNLDYSVIIGIYIMTNKTLISLYVKIKNRLVTV